MEQLYYEERRNWGGGSRKAEVRGKWQGRRLDIWGLEMASWSLGVWDERRQSVWDAFIYSFIQHTLFATRGTPSPG